MKHNYKALVTAGCSFSNGSDTWPIFLKNSLNLKHIHFSRVSGGNGLISRGAIVQVNKVLKQFKPEEILTVIMWSGASRYEFYQTNLDTELITTSNTINPVNILDETDKNWFIVNHHWTDFYSKQFYKNFYDDTKAYIDTIENILRTQWFLDKHNINYVMTTFSKGVLPNADDINDSYLKYVYNMIDWTKFINVKSCMEWCIQSGVTGHNDDVLPLELRHPSKEQHEAFVQQVILPFINKLYPCKEG
jgi:hypothetical protein